MADFTGPCCLLIMLITAAALMKPTSCSISFLVGAGEVICGAPGYDVGNLTRADYWQFTDKGHCLGNSSSCTYMMTFCKPLVVPYANCTNASVCQRSVQSGQVTELGAYKANPFHVDNVTNGFVATFPNGSTYTTSDGKPCNTSVLINLECNSKAIWVPTVKEDTFTPSIVPVPVDVLYQPSNCLYIIKFSYAGACHKLTPAEDVLMSPGSVILIIFFVSMTVYFLCGIIVNVLRGERGVSVLPNSEFWKTLPVWIKAGCEFAFQCQCLKESGSSYDSI